MLGLPIGLGLSFRRRAWRSAGAGGPRSSSPPRPVCSVRWPHCSFASRRAAWSRAQVGERRRPGSPYKVLLSIPTLWWIIASGALHNFNMYALGTFLASFLIRYHGVTLAQAGCRLDVGVRPLRDLRPVRRWHCRRRAQQRRKDGRLIVADGSRSPFAHPYAPRRSFGRQETSSALLS